jgi:hypothetical protein
MSSIFTLKVVIGVVTVTMVLHYVSMKIIGSKIRLG